MTRPTDDEIMGLWRKLEGEQWSAEDWDSRLPIQVMFARALLAEQTTKDAGEDAKFMDAFKSGQAIRVDWPMEPSTPEEALELLDMMDVEYAKTMGKSAPDAEMGNSMRRVRHMACDLWAWQKETMRESFNEAIRAARAAERKA